MATERREHVETVRDGDYAQRRRVVEYAPETRQVIVSRVNKFIWLVTAVIVGLLAFRFVLKLIAANAANTFTDLIYKITDVMVAPFNGIVANPATNGGSVVDTAALFAAVVYILAAWVLVMFIRILFSSAKRARHVTTIESES